MVKKYIVAISGASGACYAARVLYAISTLGHQIECVISKSGERVLEIEEGLVLPSSNAARLNVIRNWAGINTDANIVLHSKSNIAATIASGSYTTEGMVVVPCSGGTLAKIANGISGGLLERAAEVCLKEKRKLVLVPREMPVSLTHLRNLVLAAEAGATILPASPGFYNKPQKIQDLVDMVAGRVLHQLGLDNALMRSWSGAN